MKLHYKRYGSGHTLIILHGLMGSGDNWTSISRKLSEKYEVFVPDFRNHGASPHHEDFSMDVLVEDIREFIESHRIKAPVIIGHSMGGKVAMALAFKYPDLVRALIVVDVGLKKIAAVQPHISLLNTVLEIDASAFDSREVLGKLIDERIKERRLKMFLFKNLRRTKTNTFEWKINARAIKNNLKEVVVNISPESIFNRPVLFIKGGLSPYLPDQDIPNLKQYFSDFRMEVIPGASHWVHADKPEEFMHTLNSFLGENQI